MARKKTVVLSRGAHEPDGEYCLMEHISVRAELSWSDHPPCTHRVLATMARRVNDRLDDEARQELLELEDDLLTAPPVPELEPALSVGLAVWSAEQVLPIYEARYPGDERPRKAIEAARAWLAEPTAEHRQAADAAAYAYDAADAAADAAAAAAAVSAGVSVPAIPKLADLLRGLIAEYRRLAGAEAMRSERAAVTTG